MRYTKKLIFCLLFTVFFSCQKEDDKTFEKEDKPKEEEVKPKEELKTTSDLLSFTIEKSKNEKYLEKDIVGIIEDGKILLKISEDVDVTKLIATFTHNGKTVLVGTTEQVSGVTTNDFSKQIAYIIEAEKKWTQTVYAVNIEWIKEGYSIKWDDKTLTCIADLGYYPRMNRINDNSLLVLFENGKGDVVLRRSFDEAATWSEPKIIYKSYVYENQGKSTKINIANPEFIQLSNGDIVAGFNLRPATNGVHPFSIAVKLSKDNGVTWSQEQVIYKAGLTSSNGCWEPSFLELPGTVQVYFANEFPYTGGQQDISMLSSSDKGVTWTKEVKDIVFRKSNRDGMPVAVLDGEHIILSIEDNVSGQFQPYIIKETIKNAWSTVVSGTSNKRYNALLKPLPANIYAGAPYLIKTDDGLFILSYQSTENRNNDWSKSTMEVVVSSTPNNFRNPTRPFNVPLNKEALWNSLTDLGERKVAALSTTNFKGGNTGIWMIKGEIIDNK